MHPVDRKIADSAGINPLKAQEIFEEAADTYEQIKEFYDRFYESKSHSYDDDGETLKQIVERYRLDY